MLVTLVPRVVIHSMLNKNSTLVTEESFECLVPNNPFLTHSNITFVLVSCKAVNYKYQVQLYLVQYYTKLLRYETGCQMCFINLAAAREGVRGLPRILCRHDLHNRS